MEGTLQDALKA